MNETRQTTNEPTKLDIEGFSQLVGEYGRFQKMLNLILGLMLFPYKFVIFIMLFTALEPEWTCIANSTICSFNGTFTGENDELRCNIPRSEWEYVQSKDYSVIVEYDLACGNEWLIHMATSVIFLGAFFGAIFLGWYSDRYGRKRLLYLCFVGVIASNVLTVYMPNIWLFIALRFVSGFLVAAVHPCYYVMITESVGDK